jgi:hypothetical protein
MFVPKLFPTGGVNPSDVTKSTTDHHFAPDVARSIERQGVTAHSAKWSRNDGGEGGILFRVVLKIPVLMVKTNPNCVKQNLGRNSFCHWHWRI